MPGDTPIACSLGASELALSAESPPTGLGRDISTRLRPVDPGVLVLSIGAPKDAEAVAAGLAAAFIDERR